MGQLLDAEITHFAAGSRSPLTLEMLLADARCPSEAARRVHSEIPKHFAARIRQLEERPDWEHEAELAQLHSLYSTSFKEMRMVELGDDPAPFIKVVKRLKKRQRDALPLISFWLRKQRPPTPEAVAKLNVWLRRFLNSRVSTEMLTSQYIAIMQQQEKGSSPITGIVDHACDPEAIFQTCASHAAQLCVQATGINPRIDVEVRSQRSTSFSYIPMYLQYVLLELLKNSCSATAKSIQGFTNVSEILKEAGKDPAEVLKISCVICSDDDRITIQISDRGGGIPFEVGDHIWDYCWTSHEEATPLEGYGVGLPLSRLYANYLGGSLSVVSLPEYGVDNFLTLPRIECA